MDFLERTIQTDNFLLEPIKIQHAKLLFESLKPAQLYTYIPIDAPTSLEFLEKKYERWEKRFSADKNEIWLNYAIVDKKDNNYKGTLQATIIKKSETYIAYEVFPEFWRKGIAKECISKLLHILFEEFNRTKITAHIDTRNTASLKLLESLQFKNVRKIHDADYFKGQTSDEFVYELAKKAWVDVG